MTGISAHFRPWAGFILIGAAIFGVAIWGCFRGFDFTDEGVYYLSLNHPEEVSDFHTSYHLIGRGLFAIAGHSILATRILVATISSFAAAVFFYGLCRWEIARNPDRPLAGLLIAVGACTAAAVGLAFAGAPLAPSYNLLNAALLYLSVGLILVASTEAAFFKKSYRRFVALAAFIGLLLATDFFVKFSTCVPLAASGALFLGLAGRASWRTKLQVAAFTLIVVALGAALFFLKFQDFAAWKNGSTGLRTELVSRSFLNSYFGRYWTEFTDEFIATAWTYLPALNFIGISAVALLGLRRWPRVQRWGAIVAGVALLCTVVTAAWPQSVLRQTGPARFQFYLATLTITGVALGCSALVARRPANEHFKFHGRTLLLSGWFIFLPFFGAVGTTNDISANLFYQFAPWLVVIALCLRGLDRCWRTTWALPVGVTLVCAVAFAQFLHGFLEKHYRIPSPLRLQTEPTLIGFPSSTLRLDPASHNFINATRTQLTAAGFRPGDDIFAFFNLPGLVFAVGGVSPGHPWYFAGDQRSLDLDAMRVASVSPQRRGRAFIITNGDVTTFLPQLRAAGIDFPSSYLRCGETLKNPLTQETVEIWRAR